MLYHFIWQENELTSTISENCFWTISFSATFSQIGTAVEEQVNSPLGKNELKAEPNANCWRKMTSKYYTISYCTHTEQKSEQTLIISTAFQLELQSSKTVCWILSEKREQGVWNIKYKHSYRCIDATSSWVGLIISLHTTFIDCLKAHQFIRQATNMNETVSLRILWRICLGNDETW